MGSEYMVWAKTRSHARFNLATSGVLELALSELPVRLEDIEINGPTFYGYPPLQERLAAKLGMPEERVVAATGTSMANYLALAAFLKPGDEVVIEDPTYDPLLAVAHYLQADVRRFARRSEDGFAIDLDRIEEALTPRTRLVVLTNLHNPTSALADTAVLRAVGESASRVGAKVVVDEVYLETLFEAKRPSASHLGPEFVVTGSLTKAYGLSGLRCGWVVAEPEAVARMWRLNDLFGNVPAHVAECLSLIALDHLEAIASRAKRLLDANRRHLLSFLSSRSDLEVAPPPFGTVAFPRLAGGNVDRLCVLLQEKYETSVVPGRFFGRPDHFRVGIGGDTETLVGGLERLGAALNEIRGSTVSH
jgi:aspartate/methionine/tyrosine aminotransferase